jgi:hypothetical protein
MVQSTANNIQDNGVKKYQLTKNDWKDEGTLGLLACHATSCWTGLIGLTP